MTEPLFVPTEITLLAGLAIGLLVGWVARSLWEHPDEDDLRRYMAEREVLARSKTLESLARAEANIARLRLLNRELGYSPDLMTTELISQLYLSAQATIYDATVGRAEAEVSA